MEGPLAASICPISHKVMIDPVIAADDYSYEKESILKWFESNNTSPVTHATIQNTTLRPNYTLKLVIDEHQQRQQTHGTVTQPEQTVNKINDLEAVVEGPQAAVITSNVAIEQALARMHVDDQKDWIGQQLMPLLRESHGDIAPTLLGMLLEKESSELVTLLSSPERLDSKVIEALGVMQSYQAISPHYVVLPATRQSKRVLDLNVQAAAEKKDLGQKLLPLIQGMQLDNDYAARLTDMLLLMDNAHIIQLLESPDALKLRVDEALSIAQAHD